MLVKLSTNKTVSETAFALQDAVQANHFGVMQVHNLKETMTKKGVEFARECLNFKVCQPPQAKKVPDVALAQSNEVASLDPTTTLLLDVRRPDERAQGFLPGSSHIPLDELRQRLSELPRDRAFVHECQPRHRGCRFFRPPV